MAAPWLRRLVAGLSPRSPGSVHVGFVVDKVALGQVFLRVLRFPLSLTFHRCSITRKEKLIIFLIGLHNKPAGCGASVASAARPFNKKHYALKGWQQWNKCSFVYAVFVVVTELHFGLLCLRLDQKPYLAVTVRRYWIPRRTVVYLTQYVTIETAGGDEEAPSMLTHADYIV
jgi:hypothetical protein